MARKVYVVGVGMTKFEKPGTKSWDYPDMAKEAGEKALADAGTPTPRWSRPPSATAMAIRRADSAPSTSSA